MYTNRRQFLASATKAAAAIATGAAVIPSLFSGCRKRSEENIPATSDNGMGNVACVTTENLSADDRTIRTSLAYVDKTPLPHQRCNNCKLYTTPLKGAACGGCKIIPGPISPLGYCRSWYAQM